MNARRIRSLHGLPIDQFCRECGQAFDYSSGLLEERLCSQCVLARIEAANRQAAAHERAVMRYEARLYGEDVCMAYLIQIVARILQRNL